MREAWRPYEWHDEGVDEIGDPVGDIHPGTAGIQYRADDDFKPIENTQDASEAWCDLLRPDEACPSLCEIRWRPSIHMPRWASRITLEVTDVRVERLQEISGAGAVAEGASMLDCYGPHCPPACNESGCFGAVEWFQELWNSINTKPGTTWEDNPWVWVVEFRRDG
ncbi:MAG: hypothetical protein AAGJ55_09755 [Cyanobacteria bacterium J06555_12]